MCTTPLPYLKYVSLITCFAAFMNNPNDPTKQSTGFGFGQQTQQAGGTTQATPSTPQSTPSAFGVSSTPATNPPVTGGFGQGTASMFARPAATGFGIQPAGGAFGSGTAPPAPVPKGFGEMSGPAATGTTGMAQPSAFGLGLNNPPSTFGGATTSGFGTNKFEVKLIGRLGCRVRLVYASETIWWIRCNGNIWFIYTCIDSCYQDALRIASGRCWIWTGWRNDDPSIKCANE